MEDCIFCKLAKGEIPTDMVYEDDLISVFRDAAPEAPVHVLMVPKKHVASLNDLEDADRELMGHMMLKIKDIAAQEGLDNGIEPLSILEKMGSKLFTTCTFIFLDVER